MDSRLEELRRAGLLGDKDATKRYYDILRSMKPRIEYHRFRFRDFGISIISLLADGTYQVRCRLTNTTCKHKHKNRSQAKKCAIRICKKILRKQHEAGTSI